MGIIDEPLNIGAPDLLRGVEYSYNGELDVKYDTILGEKWKSSYIIVSQGCLYIYANRKAKKADQSFSFNSFKSAEICPPHCRENVCFCLLYKPEKGKAPLLFSCDTLERREELVYEFSSAIAQVQSVLNKVSADSGIGSAEAVPRNRFKVPHGNNEHHEPRSYDEVEQTNFQASLPVQASDDDSEYEFPGHFPGAKRMNKDNSYEDVYVKRPGISPSAMKQGQQRRAQEDFKSKFKKELEQTVGRKCAHERMNEIAAKPATDNSLVKTSAFSGERLSQSARPSDYQSSMLATASVQSVPLSSLSVNSRGDCAGIEESLSLLSVRGHESDDNICENEDDTDSSNDSDRTSPKTIYENPELGSMELHRFEKKHYFCDRDLKGNVKRILKQKPTGVFAVFRGASTPYKLCVMTPHDIKYFRTYSQNDRVSLFKSHKLNTFSSLDDLLSYYNANDLPSTDYSVKLLRGYNSMN